jgi:hypothetical protein
MLDLGGQSISGFRAIRRIARKKWKSRLWEWACIRCGHRLYALAAEIRERTTCPGCRRRDKAQRLRDAGKSLREIARLMRVSHQRVSQWLAK